MRKIYRLLSMYSIIPFNIVLVILNTGMILSQECGYLESAVTYINSSLESDMYYYGDFVKDDIRSPQIYVMKEYIDIDYKRFGVNETAKGINAQTSSQIEVKHRGIRDKANYLLFTSPLEANQLMVQLVHNRMEQLNVKNQKTEFETWSRMNNGMSYLFIYNDAGCIINVYKKFVSRD